MFYRFINVSNCTQHLCACRWAGEGSINTAKESSVTVPYQLVVIKISIQPIEHRSKSVKLGTFGHVDAVIVEQQGVFFMYYSDW